MASKHIFGGLFLVLAMLCACQAACPADSPYAKLSPSHTRCKDDRGTDIPLTTADIKAIVDKHNEVRAAVSPPAANMQKMVWDEDLAETAAKWARVCTGNHEGLYIDRAEPKLPGVSIGQNMAFSSGFSGMMDAISNSFKKGWLDEKADFTYGQKTSKAVGHYTQMIAATTRLIGCGMADCSAVDNTYKQHKVCNYAVR
ncbi:cysteine-rich venom protein-like [Littorina saxatilis]|uniref:cysteine-rich venom protein-like n=1 Tax=Littorina saxatilis TaxID=31220 RepID=UPI0038B6846C